MNKAMVLFDEAIYNTVEAMREHGVSTVSELHDHQDANKHTERLYDYLTDLLWDDDAPDPGMNVASSLVNAAQDMADLEMAEQIAAVEEMRR